MCCGEALSESISIFALLRGRFKPLLPEERSKKSRSCAGMEFVRYD